MKVLDLFCEHQHAFEGWFASEADFRSQLDRGLVQCPLCGSATINKRLSAPRLNLSAARNEPQTSNELTVAKHTDTEPSLTAAWLALTKRILANTDDVGEKFAEEARKIHYGESTERSIRGNASVDETQALIEEGIAVMPLYVPDVLKGPLQ
jgi:hypothetical protein